MGEIEFVEDTPAVGVRDDNVYLEWPDGRRIGMPLRVGRLTERRLTKAIAEHDARRAEVVPFRKKRGTDHAASS